jgi:hypothetical protein
MAPVWPQSAGEIRARLAASLEVPRWRQADAHAWWQEHGEALQPEVADTSNSDVTRALAVNPDRMR